MRNPHSLKNQALHVFSVAGILFALFFTSQVSLAAQEAIITSERALIYSDMQMSSVLGYAIKGKKVLIGEIPRNKAQVYPITVSGKIAYIKAKDVSTDKKNANTDEFVAERFLKSTEVIKKTRYSLSYLSFASQMNNTANNGSLADQDSLVWSGVSLRGDLLISTSWDIIVLANYLQASKEAEAYRMIEVGMGLGYRIIEFKRLILRWDTHLMAVPYSTYALDSLFRINGYGASGGTGLNLSLRVTESFGLDLFGGIYYTKLTGFDAPKSYDPLVKYNSPTPSFVGNRIGLGLSYFY